MRRAAPFLLALVAVGGLAFADGGYDPPSWGWAAIGLAWAAAAGIVLHGRVGLSRLELTGLAAFGLLAAWAAISVVWTVSVPLSVLDAQRLLVLPLGLAAFLAVGRSGLLEGVVVAATVASAWNLVTRVGAGSDLGETAQPLGYGNGVAILAGTGFLLALGLARERPVWLVACAPLGAALLLSESRGGMLAVGVGGAAFAALRSRRAPLAFPLVLVAGAVLLGTAGVAGSDERSAYWSVTAEASAERPLLGSGA